MIRFTKITVDDSIYYQYSYKGFDFELHLQLFDKDHPYAEYYEYNYSIILTDKKGEDVVNYGYVSEMFIKDREGQTMLKHCADETIRLYNDIIFAI